MYAALVSAAVNTFTRKEQGKIEVPSGLHMLCTKFIDVYLNNSSPSMQSSINLQVFASFQKCCVVSLHHIYMLQEPKRFREYSIWCAGEHFNTICLYDKKEKKIKKGPSAELRGERTGVSSSNHRMSIFSSLIMVKHLVSTWVHWK